MKFFEKLNKLSEGLLELSDKFDKIDKDSLMKDDREELEKIEELINFYSNTILELAIDQNQAVILENKEMVKRIIKDIESFIIEVKQNINEEFIG